MKIVTTFFWAALTGMVSSRVTYIPRRKNPCSGNPCGAGQCLLVSAVSSLCACSADFYGSNCNYALRDRGLVSSSVDCYTQCKEYNLGRHGDVRCNSSKVIENGQVCEMNLYSEQKILKTITECQVIASLTTDLKSTAWTCNPTLHRGFAELFRLPNRYNVGATKSTMITNTFGKFYHDEVIRKLQNSPYTILIKPNDQGEDKVLAILARIVDDYTARIHFVTLLECMTGTAEHIFNKLDRYLRKNNISWLKCIAFESDNCSVMKGKHKGVISLIRKQNPKAIDLGCIAHLTNLCNVAAAKTLPFQIDDLIVDIYYHFEKKVNITEVASLNGSAVNGRASRRRFLLNCWLPYDIQMRQAHLAYLGSETGWSLNNYTVLIPQQTQPVYIQIDLMNRSIVHQLILQPRGGDVEEWVTKIRVAFQPQAGVDHWDYVVDDSGNDQNFEVFPANESFAISPNNVTKDIIFTNPFVADRLRVVVFGYLSGYGPAMRMDVMGCEFKTKYT